MKQWSQVLAVTACLMICEPGWARILDLTDRQVPCAISESGILKGTLDSRFVPPSQSILLKPELTSETAALEYGLFLPGFAETTVTINGIRLPVIPLERDDGRVYRVDPMYLEPGPNTLRLDSSNAHSWSGLALFSLRDTIEEAHFAEMFSDPVEAATTLAARDVQPSSSQMSYDVLWYDCTWVPSITSASMQPGSEVTMCARALVNDLQTIDLDFDMNLQGNGGAPMTISRVDAGPGTNLLGWSYDAINYRIRITLPSPVAAGSEFRVRIGYHGAPNTDAPSELFRTNPMYASTTGAGRPVVYSVSQPYGGRRWWPSKDHPSDKPTSTIQRIIFPKPAGYTLTAVSNGILDTVVDNGSSLTYIWRNEYPIATYLMSFAISDYVYRGGTYTSRNSQVTMPVGHWIYPENIGIEGNGYVGTLQVMNFFADKFGEYPFLDQKYQTATWNISYAIEHQTATSMPAGQSGGVGNGLTRRNIHELAHQWFGNKITCANWDHTWLNEGFATYCEALAYEHLNGRNAYFDHVRGWNPSTVAPVVGPGSDQFQSSTVYHKGAIVLHMLRYVLGDERFFKALRDYLGAGYTTAVSQPQGQSIDFQSAVEQSAGMASGSLSAFFTQWLYSPNANYAAHPDYSFSAAYDVATSTAQIRIGQHQGRTPFHMPIDVQFTRGDNQTTTVRVPAGSSALDVELGFVPVTADLDPESWVFKGRRASINTSALPKVAPGIQFNFLLQGESDAGGLSWQKLTGSPAWIVVSAGGTVSGTAPTAGTYPVNVRLRDSTGVTVDASFDLVVAEVAAPAEVVINEVLYEVYGSLDVGEYVELRNNSQETADVSGWQLVLVNGGTGEPVSLGVTFPAGTTIAAGDYLVVGNSAALSPVYGSIVDFDAPWQDSIQDGAPDALVLKTAEGTRVDSLNYRADIPFGNGSHSSFAMAEGGIGRGLSRPGGDPGNAVLGRLPDGVDTNENLHDFALIPPSPGSANSTGVALPFFDDFNNSARPEWKPAFDGPVRTAAPGQNGKPLIAAPAPAGGMALEVYDSAGGGDVVYLPGDFTKLNVEGYIWIPQSSAQPWSVGIGIGTRAESAWFSSTTGYGMEHGFYLEYQNGPGLGLKGGRIADAAGLARLIIADSSQAAGVGNSGFTATSVGAPATPLPSSWQRFRLFMDGPANRAYAKLGASVIFDGPVPANMSGLAGGVTIGFRENHTNGPDSVSREGTWVDDITVNTDTATVSAIGDYYLY